MGPSYWPRLICSQFFCSRGHWMKRPWLFYMTMSELFSTVLPLIHTGQYTESLRHPPDTPRHPPDTPKTPQNSLSLRRQTWPPGVEVNFFQMFQHYYTLDSIQNPLDTLQTNPDTLKTPPRHAAPALWAHAAPAPFAHTSVSLNSSVLAPVRLWMMRQRMMRQRMMRLRMSRLQ